MIPQFIVDCSITMAWCFVDERTPAVLDVRNRLLTEVAITPIHWRLEVVNVLLMAEKRGRISSADSDQFWQALDALNIEQDNEPLQKTAADILVLGRTHKLTSYDAAYLDLAIRRQLPLATLDKDLRQAATLLGIPLLGL